MLKLLRYSSANLDLCKKIAVLFFGINIFEETCLQSCVGQLGYVEVIRVREVVGHYSSNGFESLLKFRFFRIIVLVE